MSGALGDDVYAWVTRFTGIDPRDSADSTGDPTTPNVIKVGGVPVVLPVDGHISVANAGGRPMVLDKAAISEDATWEAVGKCPIAIDPASTVMTSFRAKSPTVLAVGGNFVLSSDGDGASGAFAMTVNFSAKWPEDNTRRNKVNVAIDNPNAIKSYSAEYKGDYNFEIEVETLAPPVMPNEPDQPEVAPDRNGGPAPAAPAIGDKSAEGIVETDVKEDPAPANTGSGGKSDEGIAEPEQSEASAPAGQTTDDTGADQPEAAGPRGG